MKNAAIKKFVLELDGEEVSLTSKQAKQLFDALSELFERKVVVEEHHHHDYPRWYWGTYTVPYTTTTTPTVVPTTTPIWYTASNGTQFSLSDNGALTCSGLTAN